MSSRFNIKPKNPLKTDWVSFVLYVGAAIGLFALFAWVFSWDFLNPIMTGLAGAGAFLIRHKPLRKIGFPFYVEVGLTALIIVSFTLYFATEVVVPYIGEEKEIVKECRPSSMQMKCYSISQENCYTVWRAYRDKCDLFIKENADPKNLTSLTGPKLDKCQAKEFDKALKAMRVLNVGGPCEEFFKGMDSRN